MQYDVNFFGAKQDVTTQNGQYLYSVGTKNTNLQAGLKSGDLQLNRYMPDSMFYWLINKNAPYTRYTLTRRTGTSGAYAWVKDDCPVNNSNMGVALSLTGFKHDTDGNISDGGTSTSTSYARITNRRFIENMFNLSGNVSNPLWYETDALTGDSVYRQSAADIITDFDYNNLILKIKVNALDNASTNDLANYNNIETNYITSIGYTVYAGVIDSNNNNRVLTSSGTRYINGANVIGSTSSVSGACIFTDYHYKTPDLLKEWYDKNEFAIPKHLTTSNFGSIIMLGGETGTTTAYGVNFYMDSEHWELSPDNTTYRLIKHGNGVYNDDDFNYIRQCIAWLGFWFTDGGTFGSINRSDALLGINANDYGDISNIPDKVFQSVIKDGVTTGEFIPLVVAKDNDQSKWGKDWREKNGYNGRDGSDENKDRGNLKTTMRNSMIPTNTRDYAMTRAQLQQLITWCNSGFQVNDSEQFLEDFKGLNPAECVISAMYFPFDVGAMATAAVHVGNLDTGITAQYANMGANFGGGSEFTYSPLTINREFGDFRDYAPYTTIDIYVPFCGSVSLDPADVYGYDLTVTIIPDLMTGSCTGCIYRGEYLLTTIDGKIGMPITLSLGQVGEYQNAVTQAQFNLKNANRQMFNSWLGAVASVGAIATGAGAVVGIAGLTGSAMGMLQAQENIKKAEYDLAHIARNFNTVGSVSDVNTVMVLPEYVHMIIKRPYNLQGADITQYAHTVGHACNRQGYVSDFSGYTLASDIDLTGVSATADELEQIRKYFATGVYL